MPRRQLAQPVAESARCLLRTGKETPINEIMARRLNISESLKKVSYSDDSNSIARQKDMAARASPQPSQTTPAAMVATVKGAPTLKYSKNRSALRGAPSGLRSNSRPKPRMVRLPAAW